MKKNLSHLCLSFLLIVACGSAFAQNQPPIAKKPKEPTAKTNEKPTTSENDIGNLRREGIDVVQNRVFLKRNRHELGVGIGLIFDNPILQYEMAEFRYTYHIREAIAIEASYAYAFHQTKAIVTDLENLPCASPPVYFDSNGDPIADPGCGVVLKPAPDPYQHIFNGNIVWAPIYGKFSIFSKKILHFDIFATAGAGYYMAEVDDRFGFNVGIGSKIFINDWTAVRIDFRNFTIKESAPFSHIINNRILSIGMSFFLPTHVSREQ